MKIITLSIICCLISFFSFGQNMDKIFPKGKKPIDCTITNIDKKEISYRIEANDGSLTNYKIPFKDVENIETSNKLIMSKFNEVKTEMDVPPDEDVKKAFLLIGGGAALLVGGVGVMALSNAPGIREHKRGQFLATGQVMAVSGLALGGLGFYQLKKAKDKN